MDYQALADLLFPEVTDTPEMLMVPSLSPLVKVSFSKPHTCLNWKAVEVDRAIIGKASGANEPSV